MNKLGISILFLVVCNLASAQSNSEFGMFGGVAYYLGDINPKKQLYSNSVALGGIYRYNFTPRYSLRVGMLFSSLSGKDLDFKNSYQQSRGASFATDLVDLSLQAEFNFQSFGKPGKLENQGVTPYVTGGVGYIAPTSSASSVTIPMGVGVKARFGNRWTAAFEWNFRKTFTDELDYLDDPNNFNETNLIFNNDWASFLGMIISFKLSPDDDCYSNDTFAK